MGCPQARGLLREKDIKDGLGVMEELIVLLLILWVLLREMKKKDP